MQMDWPSFTRLPRLGLLALITLALAVPSDAAIAQSTTLPAKITTPPRGEPGQNATAASYTREISAEEARKKDHPLYPVLQIARRAHATISKDIRDYTCTIVRRERIAGKLQSHEFIDAKIRHQQLDGDRLIEPFSVYLQFTKPARVAGREALYVEGENAGKVFVRRGGERMAHLSTFIKPDSRLAMRDNRYPITDIGFQKLVERLIEVVESDLNYDECEVNFYSNAKVDQRVCTRIEVIHPVKREHFKFHRAMVFVDDKDQLPIAYVSYTWPENPGGQPRLLEEYVYTNIVLNPGLTDQDFDRDNPAYGFTDEVSDEVEE